MKRLQEMNAKKEAAMIESVTNVVNILAELRNFSYFLVSFTSETSFDGFYEN